MKLYLTLEDGENKIERVYIIDANTDFENVGKSVEEMANVLYKEEF